MELFDTTLHLCNVDCDSGLLKVRWLPGNAAREFAVNSPGLGRGLIKPLIRRHACGPLMLARSLVESCDMTYSYVCRRCLVHVNDDRSR